MIDRVIKRNGDIVDFDIEKPIAAMGAALNAVGEYDSNGRLRLLLTDELKRFPTNSLHIEEIQDVCEKILLGAGHFRAGRAFIRYRDERNRLRADATTGISEYIYNSKYRGPHDLDWSETVNRTKAMHLRKFEDTYVDHKMLWEHIENDFNLVEEMKVLPSMRSLQFGGYPIESNNARMFNCSYCPIASFDFFYYLYFLLLSGCGVGYSVEPEYIDKLPVLKSPNLETIRNHLVDDSIQGWAAALLALLDSYRHGEWYIEFDYSSIRPLGSSISSGGNAPGHTPLKKALERIREIMDGAIGRKLRSFELHRMCCIVADSVLSGGIRRSSMICLFDADDDEMFNCKRGNWWNKYPELAMANNSAHYWDPAYLSGGSLDKLLKSAREYGEPGYFVNWRPGFGTNPCGEITLDSFWDFGYGFSFCNLTEINAVKCKTFEEFREAALAATRIGVLQSAYNDIAKAANLDSALSEKTDAIAKNKPLLGVSVTGIFDNLEVIEWMPKVASEIANYAVSFASSIGVEPPRRVTCIKPSGTASLLLGGVSSGIHPHHSKRYIRRVTANRNESVFKAFAAANPQAVTEKPNGDFVIEFPCAAPDGSKTLDNLTAIEHLEIIKKVYDGWVIAGGLGEGYHNVSATVVVRDNEWDEIEKWLCLNTLPSISFLAHTGDKDYAFAPREACRTAPELEYWNSLRRGMVPVDYGEGMHFTDKGSACEGFSCEL